MSRLKTLKNIVTSKAGRQILTAQKHAPVILFGAGVIGVITAAVLASRATLKLDELLQDAEDTVFHIENSGNEDYTNKDRERDILVVKAKTVVNVAKLYAPAVGVGMLSVAALTGSHVILTNRNMALTAVAASLQKTFDSYRSRVREELGCEKDNEFRYGVVEREIVEETAEGPVTKTVRELDPNGFSLYAKVFDQNSRNWDRYAEHNMIFLRAQQEYLNNLLHARGHVFLNEVYDALDIPRTRAGAVVGWILSKKGDNYIDFGIFSGSERSRAFVNGLEGAIWLDFNVDGIIYDKITEDGDCE